MAGNVVLMSPIHWHFTWQSAQKISAGLAKRGYHVYFIEPMPKRWPSINEYKRVWGRLSGQTHLAGISQQIVPQNVKIISPFFLPDTNSFLQAVNIKLLTPHFVKQLLAQILSPNKPLICINYVPIRAAMAVRQLLKPDLTVFACVHDWPHDPHVSDPFIFIEDQFALQSDIVFADAQQNIDRLKEYGSSPYQILPSVEYEMFANAHDDKKTPPRKKPLCAYFGTIGENIDIDLLRKVSHQYPLRLIGPSRYPLDDFGEHTEILGSVPYEKVPHLLADVDVLLLPYGSAPHVDGVVPAKLFECLATGKPVISYGLQTIREYQGIIEIVDTHQAFLEAIATAFQADSASARQTRLKLAQENGYEQRMDEIETVLRSALKQAMGKQTQ